ELRKAKQDSFCLLLNAYRLSLSTELLCSSVLDHPHHPTCHYRSGNKVAETFRAVQEHVAGHIPLGNAEHDRSEEGENNRCGEMGELHSGYSFFPIAIS